VHTYAIYSSKNTPEHNMEILCVSIMCQDLFDFGKDAEMNQLVFFSSNWTLCFFWHKFCKHWFQHSMTINVKYEVHGTLSSS